MRYVPRHRCISCATRLGVFEDKRSWHEAGLAYITESVVGPFLRACACVHVLAVPSPPFSHLASPPAVI
jgi:hypothetical protein